VSQTASCPGFNYTIRAGDTFFKLAQRFGTTVAAIEAANPGVNPNNLQIGQVICIPTRPAPGPPPPTPACPNGFLYTIQAGDTFFKLAQRFGTTVAAIEAANPGVNPNNLQIGQVVCIPTRPAPGPTPPPPGCPNGFFYTIQAGDTFFLLAQRFGTTVAAIEAANPGVNPNNLQIGQVICIPVAPAPGPPPVCPGFFYTIRPGDTLFELAQRFGTTVAAIIAANPGIDPTRLVPGQQICIPVPAPPVCSGFFYTIRPGDTLFELAQRFGTTVAAIIAANPGIDPTRLVPGQQICIPVPAPPLGKRCIVMMPTDLAPNGEGVLFLDYGTNVVLGTASNVPDPTTFNQEVYKLWLREATTDNWVVTTMFRSPQDTWVGRLVPAQTLSVFTAAVISAEQAANVQRPVGSRVLTATIPPVS
jgi:peptidoglycan endopeptidase LytF